MRASGDAKENDRCEIFSSENAKACDEDKPEKEEDKSPETKSIQVRWKSYISTVTYFVVVLIGCGYGGFRLWDWALNRSGSSTLTSSIRENFRDQQNEAVGMVGKLSSSIL